MSTQTNMIHAIAGDDGRVLDFFAKFSRFECVLKKAGFVKAGAYGSASPAWEEFADTLGERLNAATDAEFVIAKSFLLEKPPRKQVFIAPSSMKWADNPKRANESDARYLLRLVRDVRNNLFHGGKYPASDGGQVDDSELRNANLLRACLTILDQCQQLDGAVGNAFLEHG